MAEPEWRPESPPDPNEPLERSPQRARNDFSWVGLALSIVAFVVAAASDVGYGPGLAALLFSLIGVYIAVRHDVGMAPALSGLLLSLTALAVAVYTAGAARS